MEGRGAYGSQRDVPVGAWRCGLAGYIRCNPEPRVHSTHVNLFFQVVVARR